MEKDTKALRHTEGLPIWVNDIDNVWQTLRIANSIPLGRLDWQYSSNEHLIRESSTTGRASFEISTSSSTDTDRSDLPGFYKQYHEWFLNPYVLIFALSVNQLENSPSTEIIWNRLRLFTELCREQNQDYLIVCVANDEDLATQTRLFEKLRNEINQTSKLTDHVVTINLTKDIKKDDEQQQQQHPQQSIITHLHHSSTHREFLLRLRDFLKQSIERRLQHYEDETSKFYENRKKPSSSSLWSLPQYLLMKEGLSFVFSHLGRRDLAVKQYENVYAILNDDEHVKYKEFCDLPAADVAKGLSNVNYRDYQKMLLKNSITEVDLHTYIVARQFVLLLQDRRYTQIAEKATKFISHFVRRCNDEILLAKTNSPSSSTISSQIPINIAFRDIWTFTCARAMSSMLAQAVPPTDSSPQELSAKLATQRERFAVRLVAGFHIQALKPLQSLADVVLPGCLTSTEDSRIKEDERPKLMKQIMSTSNEKLKQALSSPKSAETAYSEIANAAASLYEMGQRVRGAAALDGDAGRIHLMNKSYEEAESLLSAQCSRFMNDQGWDMLHRVQRASLAEAEKQLKRTQEYLVSCLTMLNMGRTSRSLIPISEMSDEEINEMKKDAKLWMTETIKAAQDLPKLMRYKADRLFDVAVERNEGYWEDGSPGHAIVRIKSDILTEMNLDYITLECKCLDVPSAQKSALHQRHESETKEKNDDLTSKDIDPATADILLLRSSDNISLKTGKNIIEVFATEIPGSGRYRVNLVSMFLGKLKFVYTASKMASNPVAFTHKTTASKKSLSSSSSSPLVDFGVFQAQTPLFYAAERSLSASINYGTPSPLYLVKEAKQFVTLDINAHEKGILSGAKLKCTLVALKSLRGSSDTSQPFLEFSQNSDASSNSNDTITLNIQKSKSTDLSDNILDIGEGVLKQGLKSGERLHVKIGFNVLHDANKLGRSEYRGLNTEKCNLISELTWREREGSIERKFSCRKQLSLVFKSPINVAAELELHSKWSSDDPSRVVGLDGTPLGDGGTLLCSISSRTSNEIMNLRNISLETPSWLEPRPNEEPPHVSLLPCTLQSGSEFVCAFDMSVREGEQDERDFIDDPSNNEELQEDALKQRLSRRVERHLDKSKVEAEETKERIRKDDELTQAEISGELIATPRDDKDFHQDEIRRGENSTMVESEEDTGVEDSQNPANELVDLSSVDKLVVNDGSNPAVGNNVNDSENKEVGSLSVATLKIELKIANVVDWTTIERKVSLVALKGKTKRYGIERQMRPVGEVGKIMEMEIRVWFMGSDDEEAKQIEYEIEVNFNVWTVIGQKRGSIEVLGGNEQGGGGTRIVKLLPIEGGRHSAPRIQLYEGDGRAINASRCDIFGEHMQVVVTPCRTVVSACRGENIVNTNGGEDETKGDTGNMPLVISSNRLFDS